MKKYAIYLIVLFIMLLIMFFYAHQQKYLIVSFNEGSRIQYVAMSSSGRYVAAINEVGTIVLWEVQTKQQLHRFSFVDVNFFDLVFSENEQILIAGGDDGILRGFDVITGENVLEKQVITPAKARVILAVLPNGQTYPEVGGIFQLSISDDGRFLVAAGVNGEAAIIDTTNWMVISTTSLGRGFDVTDAAFDRSSKFVSLSSRVSGDIVVWGFISDQQELLSGFGDLYDSIDATSFGNSDAQLFIVGYPRYVASIERVGDTFDMISQASFDVRNFSVVRISPDRAVIGRGGSFSTGDKFTDGLPFFSDNDYAVYLYKFLEQDSITQSRDGLCYQKDAGRPGITIPIACPVIRPFQQLSGHRDRVVALDFSRDHRRLVSGSRDGTVRVWYVQDP